MVEKTQSMGEGSEIPVHNRSKYTIDERVLDLELRRKLWDGQLPLKIDLSLNDLFHSETPRSLYVSNKVSLTFNFRSWHRDKTTFTIFYKMSKLFLTNSLLKTS